MFRLATIALRPETGEDLPFLRDLYQSVRDDEPGFRDLDPVARKAMLDQQFAWQRTQYLSSFPQGWFTIVMADERPAGRFYLARIPDSLRIIDISLLPEYRGHGIGTQLLKNVQAESIRTQVPIRLSVVAGGSAVGFYANLGFRIVRGDGVRLEMAWNPRVAAGKLADSGN